jgi:hypothetical protein
MVAQVDKNKMKVFFLDASLYGKFVKKLLELMGEKECEFLYRELPRSKRDVSLSHAYKLAEEFPFLKKWKVKVEPCFLQDENKRFYIAISCKIDVSMVDKAIDDMILFNHLEPMLVTPSLKIVCSHEEYLEIETDQSNFERLREFCKKSFRGGNWWKKCINLCYCRS